MRQKVVLAALAVAVLLAVAIPTVGLAAVGDAPAEETGETENSTNQTVPGEQENRTAPGEQFSGVVGVGEAELEGDVEQRAFGHRVAQAASQNARADVVAEQVETVEQRLDALEQRKETLTEQRERGEISEGKYRAKMAQTVAEIRVTGELGTQSNETAGQLPADLLAERGVDAERIQALQNRASNLSGGEVAEIARGIAGPNPGETPGRGPPADVPNRPDTPADDRTDDDRPGNGMDERNESGESASDDRPGGPADRPDNGPEDRPDDEPADTDDRQDAPDEQDDDGQSGR